MKRDTPSTKGSGKSKDIPTGVLEPDQIASSLPLTGPENTTYSGMRGNMILFLADRQDRVAKRLNMKIERLEERVQAK